LSGTERQVSLWSATRHLEYAGIWEDNSATELLNSCRLRFDARTSSFSALMSCSKVDPSLHQAKKPEWIKVRLPSSPVFFSTKALISDLRLHTVCESAQCPN